MPATKAKPKPKAKARKAQPRLPAGTPTKGNIHPGEWTADSAPAPATRGRKSGAPVPKTAPIHQGATGQTGTSAADRAALAAEHESRLPEEMAGGFKCVNCSWGGWREHPVVSREGKWHATLAFAGCTRCGTLHQTHVGVAGKHSPQHSTARREAIKPSRVDERTSTGGARGQGVRAIGKSIDTSDGALQRADDGPTSVEYVGHRINCPRGGDSPCGGEVDGQCGICAAPVQDHEALGKTRSVLLDLRALAGLS